MTTHDKLILPNMHLYSVAFRKIVYCLFLLLTIACNEEEEKFDPYAYNGEYPRNLDGSQIKTYTPEIQGGKMNVSYNGHKWNHTPNFLLTTDEIYPSDTSIKERKFEVSIYSFDGYIDQSPCAKEILFFLLPLKTDAFVLNAYSPDEQSELGTIGFSTADCGAGKDRYKLDRSKMSFIHVKDFDKVTREIRIEFDLNFIMNHRNSDFGPVYPGKVQLTGSLETIVKK